MTVLGGLLAILVGLLAPGLGTGPALADSVRDAQWYLDYLGVPEAHKVSQGDGVTVAVIDTGVNASHPDLKGNVVPGADGFNAKGKGWSDPHDHGTQMASLVAAHGHGAGQRDGVLGIAPKAKIMPITVVAPGERGAGRTAVGQGIQYATDHGADIILVPLSGAPGEGESEAVAYAKSRHVLVIASAGNKDRYGGGAMVGYPAGHEGVLAVSAIDRNGKFASFSAQGYKVGLAAPGVDIRAASAKGGYVTGDGTSQAAAIVAGLAALVKSKYPSENEVDLAVRLGGTAIDKGPEGRDDQYGLGVPDVNRALSVAKPPYASVAPSASPSRAARTPGAVDTARGRGGVPRAPRVVAQVAGMVALLVLGGLLIAGLIWRSIRNASTTPAGPAGPAPHPPFPGPPPGLAGPNPPAPHPPPPSGAPPPPAPTAIPPTGIPHGPPSAPPAEPPPGPIAGPVPGPPAGPPGPSAGPPGPPAGPPGPPAGPPPAPPTSQDDEVWRRPEES